MMFAHRPPLPTLDGTETLEELLARESRNTETSSRHRFRVPAPPRRRSGVRRVASAPVRPPSDPGTSLSDLRMHAAQEILDELDELARMRDTLLAFPEWVPVGEPMARLAEEMQLLRKQAAVLLGCNEIDLEE